MLFGATSAHADVWGYVDEQGNIHFSTRQLDPRYQLYFKTHNVPASFMPVNAPDSGQPQSSVSNNMPFNPAADAAAGLKAQRLVALINQSSAYKLVRNILLAEAKRHGVNGNLVKAIAATESGFNPQAVSPAGAIGIMQIMPDTARLLGLRSDSKQTVEQKLTDSATNVRLGVRYFSQMLRRFNGRTDLAIAAYNAGPGAVSRRMAVPPYAETQGYVRTILAIYETLQPGTSDTWVNPQAVSALPMRGHVSTAQRKHVVLAGKRTTTASSLSSSRSQAAQITLKADNVTNAESALDVVAEKITAADAQTPPAIGADVTIAPPATLR